ncbi:MAG TPA: hypothetical protein VF469_04325 [Kofleriaceae bacterium]
MQSSSEVDENGETVPAGQRPPEWKEVDRRLREYARHRAALDAAEAFDLLRAEQLKVHFNFGYVTIFEYMEHVLGYGPHAARERMRVARNLATLPETTAALARGELTYSAVRELTRVATAETEAEWLVASKGLVANQIERLVANHQPGDRPEDPTVPDLRSRVVRIELPPEAYALWRQARSVIADERGTEISDADFVEALCRGAIAPGSGVGGPAHLHAALHAGLLSMQGQAPYGIAFRWTYGPPIPAGLDPEVRKVMVTQRVNEILERIWNPETSSSDTTGSRARCPTWDADAARSTGLRGRAMPP